MPKRTYVNIDEVPYQYKNRKLQIGKSYTSPDFSSHIVLKIRRSVCSDSALTLRTRNTINHRNTTWLLMTIRMI